MNNERHSYHSGQSQAFRKSLPGTEDKDQIYFLLYHIKYIAQCLAHGERSVDANVCPLS